MPIPPPPPGFDNLDLENIGVESALNSGCNLFNHGHYWYAHEVWESVWKGIESDDRYLFQGLIQFAAALHHASHGNQHGFDKLMERAELSLKRCPANNPWLDPNDLLVLLERVRNAAQNTPLELNQFPPPKLPTKVKDD